MATANETISKRHEASPAPQAKRGAEAAQRIKDAVTGGLKAVHQNKGKAAAIGMSFLALGGAAKAESGTESTNSALAGDNQIVLVNAYPSDRTDLKALDSKIEQDAQMFNTMTNAQGWQGWQARFAQDPTQPAGKYTVENLELPLTENQIEQLNDGDDGDYANRVDDAIYAALKQQNWYNGLRYYDVYYAGDPFPATWCGVWNRADSGISPVPGAHNLGITYYVPRCLTGNTFFDFSDTISARDILANFGYPLDGVGGDIENSDGNYVDRNWFNLRFDNQGQAGYGKQLRQNSYFTWPITVNTVGNGKVVENAKSNPIANYPGGAPDPGNRFPGGETIDFTAEAAPGWHFVGWNGDVIGKTPTAEIAELDGSKDVEAIFAKNPAQKEKLTVKLKGHGTIKGGNVSLNVRTGNGASRTYTENKGQRVTLTEAPGKGEKFAGWSGACHGLMKKCVVVMKANEGVTAKFVPVKK